ncbi:wsv521 [White spot syndrome virus]|uniref:Wsv521 n=5 Tax=White spot syndrome virus TaxID=342409 RepID=Q8VAA5_WSSVS
MGHKGSGAQIILTHGHRVQTCHVNRLIGNMIDDRLTHHTSLCVCGNRVSSYSHTSSICPFFSHISTDCSFSYT